MNASILPTFLSRLRGPSDIARFLPGAMLVATITTAAYGIRDMSGLALLSPMITAIFVGVLFSNLSVVPEISLPGVNLLGKKLLRVGIALLGLQLTLDHVIEVGLAGMLILAAVVGATYLFTILTARLVGVDAGVARLLAAGVSVCGASAIAAASAVEDSRAEDASYAVALVTLYGTVAMLVCPIVATLIGLEARDYGIWIGASVHEVAHVVAAGYQFGPEAGEQSVVIKLARVLLLAPLLVTIGALLRSRHTSTGRSIPLTQAFPVFVMAFIALMLANSAGVVPVALKEALITLTPVLLTAALGAMGLVTTFGALRSHGFRPLILAGLASLFISSLVLVLILAVTTG